MGEAQVDEWLRRERARERRASTGRRVSLRALDDDFDSDDEDDDPPAATAVEEAPTKRRGLFGHRRQANAPEKKEAPAAATHKDEDEELSDSEREVAIAAQAHASTMLGHKKSAGRIAKRRPDMRDLYADDDLHDDDEYEYDDDYDCDEEFGAARPRHNRQRAPPRRYLPNYDGDEDMPLARPRRGAALARRGPSMPAQYGSRSKYVEGRLLSLEKRVGQRVEDLEDEEAELAEMRRDAIAELRKLRTEIEASGEVVPENSEDAAVETRGPRHRCRVLLARSGELAERRMRVWAALDEAEGRLGEIGVARRTLRSRGLTGLYSLVERREVSRSLRTFLEKLF